MSKRKPKSRKRQPSTRFYTPPQQIATAIARFAAEAQAQRRPQRQRKP